MNLGRVVDRLHPSSCAAYAQERGDVRVRTAAMRVCQPGPLAFQRANVSGSILRLMGTFAFGDFGRPRGLSMRAAALLPTILSSTSAAERKCLKSSAVSSRTSPSASVNGLRFAMSLCFSRVGFAKADDPDPAAGGCKTQHVQAVIQIAHRHEAPLRVNMTHVGSNVYAYIQKSKPGAALRIGPPQACEDTGIEPLNAKSVP